MKKALMVFTFIMGLFVCAQTVCASSVAEVQGWTIQKTSTGFPGIKVDLVSCQRYGSNVRIDFKMRNLSNGQSSFVVYGTSQNIPEHKSAFIDDQGNVHKGQVKIMNNGWSSVSQVASIPAGIAVNSSVMVEDVPKSAKSIALFDLRGSNIGMEDDFYQVTGRDIPITPYPQDGSNGLELCEIPSLKLDYKLCEWKNKMVHVRFTLTNVSQSAFDCKLYNASIAAFDEQGNRYTDASMSLNGGSLNSVEQFEPGVPVVCDAYLERVPSTVNFLQVFALTFPYEDWRLSLNLLNLSFPPEKTVVKKTTTVRRTVPTRRTASASRKR